MALPTLDKGKIVTIVQLVFSLLALILSIVAMAGGVADNIDTMKGSNWVGYSKNGMSVYSGWSTVCTEAMGQNACGDSEWDGAGAATAMGVLSFLFALVYLGMVAVKLFKPIKMLNMVECGVGFLGMIFALVCFAIFSGDEDIAKSVADTDFEFGPGYGACVVCFVFKLFALVLGVLTLLPAFATTEIKTPGTTEAAAGHV